MIQSAIKKVEDYNLEIVVPAGQIWTKLEWIICIHMALGKDWLVEVYTVLILFQICNTISEL